MPDRLAQRVLPDLRAAPGVDRGDLVVVVRHDEHARARPGGAPKERLGIDVAAIGGVERSVEMEPSGALVGEAGDDISPGAVERAVIGQDGGIRVSRAGSGERCDERAGKQSDSHHRLRERRDARSLPARSLEGQANVQARFANARLPQRLRFQGGFQLPERRKRSRSAINRGPVGSHLSFARVCALEAGMS